MTNKNKGKKLHNIFKRATSIMLMVALILTTPGIIPNVDLPGVDKAAAENPTLELYPGGNVDNVTICKGDFITIRAYNKGNDNAWVGIFPASTAEAGNWGECEDWAWYYVWDYKDKGEGSYNFDGDWADIRWYMRNTTWTSDRAKVDERFSLNGTYKIVLFSSGYNVVTSRTITIADHTYGSWTTTKSATCTETGSRYKTCSRCGEDASKHKVTETIPKNSSNHSGLTKGGEAGIHQKCTGCGVTTQGSSYHSYSTSTTASPGYTTYTCSCGYSYKVGHTYTVKYNGNGNTGGSTANSTHTYGTGKALTANGFTKTGYTFTGWNKKADGSGTAYADKASVNNLTSTAGQTVNLYAQWKANTYTIAYNANNGSGTMSNTSATYDANVTLRNNSFTRTNYAFVGWNTKSDGSGTSYANGATVKNLATSGTVTLYAQWEKTYTVKFNGNGNTGGSTANQTFIYGTAQNLTANGFTKTGYTFTGWNKKADGSGTAYANKASVNNLTSTAGETVNLYAQWKANTYTVTFNGNGATSGTMNDQTHTYDTPLALTENAYKKTGYTFAGWATSADGSVKYSNEESVKNLTATKDGTVTLYAKWIANTYTATFNSNGGGTPSASTIKKDYNSELGTLPTVSRTGYTFNGWYTEKSGGNKISTTTKLTADVTYYAQWTANTDTPYKVNHYLMDLNGDYPLVPDNTVSKTGTSDSTVTLSDLKDISLEGFTYAEGKVEGSVVTTTTIAPDGSRVIDLYYSRNEYQITLSNGTGIASTSGDGTYYYGEAVSVDATLNAEGYTWSHWEDAEGNVISTDKVYAFNMPTGDVSLTAVATPNTYIVEFDGNNASSGSMANLEMTYDTAKTLPENTFTKTGYVFDGWNTKADGSGTAYTDQVSVNNLTSTNGGTVTLYAQWTPITYTVTYDGNGATGGSTADSTHTYGVSKPLTANGFEKPGYAFAGWATSEDGEVEYVDKASVSNLTSTNGATITLYAQWEEPRCKIIATDTFLKEEIEFAHGNPTFIFKATAGDEVYYKAVALESIPEDDKATVTVTAVFDNLPKACYTVTEVDTYRYNVKTGFEHFVCDFTNVTKVEDYTKYAPFESEVEHYRWFSHNDLKIFSAN